MPKNYHFNSPPMPLPCRPSGVANCWHLPPDSGMHRVSVQTQASMFGPVSFIRASHPACASGLL